MAIPSVIASRILETPSLREPVVVVPMSGATNQRAPSHTAAHVPAIGALRLTSTILSKRPGPYPSHL